MIIMMIIIVMAAVVAVAVAVAGDLGGGAVSSYRYPCRPVVLDQARRLVVGSGHDSGSAGC
jgi:hypothetical protein